jgi:hypothetical protein
MEITWKVLSLLARNDYQNFQHMIVRIEWNCIANNYNQNGNLISMGAIQGETFLPPATDNFIPVSELTEAQLISWAHQIMGTKVQDMEILACRHAIASISSEENLVSVPLPWITPT